MEILKKSELINTAKTYKVKLEMDDIYECIIHELSSQDGKNKIYTVESIVPEGKESLELIHQEFLSKIIISLIEKSSIKLN